MRPILSGVDTLVQHLQQLQQIPEIYRPEFCPHCGKEGLWIHGTYSRKCDREGRGDACLNPVPIPRFYCRDCLHTCSVLPECIAPRRWYVWVTQQTAIIWYLAGTSFRKIAEKIVPHADTVWRWWSRLRIVSAEHAFHLRSHCSRWGVHQTVKSFWQAVLAECSLAKAMRLLNESDVCVP